jgi:ABC-type nitrate/sulfonate/bicarbonate transport system permease component
VRRALPAVLTVGVLIAVWELWCRLGDVDPRVLPPPSTVARTMWRSRVALVENAWPTVWVALAGLALAAIGAFVVAALMDRSIVVRAAVAPLLVGSQTVPFVVVAPLLVIWFGIGTVPKLVLVVLFTFFPMAVSWLDGFVSTPAAYDDLAVLGGASAWARFWKLRVPHAAGPAIAGATVAATYALPGALLAELTGSARGLGVYVIAQRAQQRTDRVLAAVVVVTALTAVLVGAVRLTTRVLRGR